MSDVEQLRARQSESWRQGEPIQVEQILTDAGGDDLRDDDVLELIYAEICLRDAGNDTTSAEEYVARFPHFKERIDRIFEMHRGLEEATDTTSLHPTSADTDQTLNETDVLPADRSAPATQDLSGNAGSSRTLDRAANQDPKAGGAEDISIAGYTLREPIGEGGMGRVFRARDVRLQREVAIKVMHTRYAADEENASRFVAEGRITGQLQHPGIPAIHELGTMEDGRPFLAMKLIAGRTLADLIQESQPSKESGSLTSGNRGQLIAVFEHICHAVGYAHSRQIIHRDLKPANVMVGAFGEVQVMDWGLAKRLKEVGDQSAQDDPNAQSEGTEPGSDLEGSETATQDGLVMGTLAYMPPEQARGEIGNLDPRSDVFSLGAILYEILTEQILYRGKSTKETWQLARQADNLAAFRDLDGSDADKDLAAMCKRCLASERQDRPEDAASVAKEIAGIRQHAEDRARQAEMERAEAIVREAEQKKRRRVLMSAAVALLVVLLIGIGGTTWGMLRANWHASVADTRRGEAETQKGRAITALAAETAAKKTAQKRFEQIVRGNDVIISIFEDLNVKVDAKNKEPLEAILGKRLVKAGNQLQAESVGDPLMVAQLQVRLGHTLRSLGYPKESSALFELAYSVRKRILGVEHRDTLLAANGLAESHRKAGDFRLAISLFEEHLEVARDKMGLEDEVTDLLRHNLASSYDDAGQPEKAIPHLKATLDRSRGLDKIAKLNALGESYRQMQQYAEALSYLKVAFQMAKDSLSNDDLLKLTITNNLAATHLGLGNVDDALPFLNECLTLTKTRLGAKHPNTIAAMNNLAVHYHRTGRFQQAIPLIEETIRLNSDRLGDSHPHVLFGKHNLAVLYGDSGQYRKAAPIYDETRALMNKHLGAEHPTTLEVTRSSAMNHFRLRQYPQGVALLESFRDLKKGRSEPVAIADLRSLADLYRMNKQAAKAIGVYEDIRTQLRKKQPGSPHLHGVLVGLKLAYRDAGQYKQAIPISEEILRTTQARFGPTHIETLKATRILALDCLFGGSYDKARQQMGEALALLRGQRGGTHPETLHTLRVFTTNLCRYRRFSEAIPLLEEELKAREGKSGRHHAETLPALIDLGASYREVGKLDKAISLLKEATEANVASSSQRAGEELFRAYCANKQAADATDLAKTLLVETRRQHPPNSHQLGNALHSYSTSLRLAGAYSEAAKLVREVIAIMEKGEEKSWARFLMHADLGMALRGQKKYAEAESSLLSAYKGLTGNADTIPEKFRATSIKASVEELVRLYDVWNKPDEAAKWKKTLKELTSE